MAIGSQYIRGAKIPPEAWIFSAEAVGEYVVVEVPPVLPPLQSGVMSVTKGFTPESISETASVSNTPTATESISESVVVSVK